MNNIATLYKFELRKLAKRKIVWISLAVMLVLSAFTSLSGILFNSFSESNSGESISGYEMAMRSRKYARNLAGRAIDDTLLHQMQTSADTWTYGAIYTYVWGILDHDNATMVTTNDTDLNAQSLYDARTHLIYEQWQRQQLTKKEEAFWKTREQNIQIPVIFDYTQGYKTLIQEFTALNVMVLLLVTIGLSGIFSDEHLRKTDQITLCCRLGRKPLYIAKILAGLTFGIVSAILIFLTAAITSFLVYGTDGFHAALQLVFPESSRPLSLGKTTLVLFGLLIIATLFYSIAAMHLSQRLRSSMGTMAIMVGITILTLFVTVPKNLRLFSQIYSYMPAWLINADSCMDHRLVTLFGVSFTNWQFGAALYVILGVILVLIGAGMYRRYQVRG